MKTKLFLLAIVSMLNINTIFAQSYQHWVTWYNEDVATKKLTETPHDVSVSEMKDIVCAMYNGTIKPNGFYRLSTGVVYNIPQPSLYLSYLERCIRVAEPSATTPALVIDAISKADEIQWGDDISVNVKNYYYSLLYKTVKFNDNYSGKSEGIKILAIKGIPIVKRNCGNPLEGINVVVSMTKTECPPPADKPAETITFTDPSRGRDYITFVPVKEEPKVDLNLPESPVFKHRDHKLLWIAVGVVATSAAIYLATRDWGHDTFVDDRGPVGAPTYPANTGGPTGAGTYGKVNVGFSIRF